MIVKITQKDYDDYSFLLITGNKLVDGIICVGAFLFQGAMIFFIVNYKEITGTCLI